MGLGFGIGEQCWCSGKNSGLHGFGMWFVALVDFDSSSVDGGIGYSAECTVESVQAQY